MAEYRCWTDLPFSEVFKARCKKTNAYVAMKLILMDQEKEGFPITALREIKILQELCHQNIVRLIEVCRSASTWRERETSIDCSRSLVLSVDRSSKSKFYFIFEFCDHDLAGILRNRNVQFTLGHIKSVMQQLLDGNTFIITHRVERYFLSRQVFTTSIRIISSIGMLSKMGSIGRREIFVDRDIKSANILITREGVLKLADFGLAKVITPPKRKSESSWWRLIDLCSFFLRSESSKSIYVSSSDLMVSRLSRQSSLLWCFVLHRYRPPELLLGRNDDQDECLDLHLVFSQVNVTMAQRLICGVGESSLRMLSSLCSLHRCWMHLCRNVDSFADHARQ